MKKGRKTKISHNIPDKNGMSKQYPKIMKNPERFGFHWESTNSMEYYLGKKE